MGLLGERRGLLVGVLLAVALVVLLVATGEKASLVIGVSTGSAYGIVALGLVLIYKSSGVFNFAQGEFGTVALYALYLLDFRTGYWLALLGALVAAGLMGFLTERLVVRPLFDAPRVTLLVATAGVALLAIAVEIWFGTAQGKPIAKGFDRVDRVEILGVQISDQRLWLIVTLVVLAVVLGLFFTRTNLGLAIIGASQEPTATELAGISVRRLSSFTWVLAALLGGLGALIAVPDGGSFGPGIMTSTFLIPAFTAAVLGGMTSLPGAFVGGVLIGIVESVATSAPLFEDIPGTKSTLVVFIVLLAVLVIRPQGLFGEAGLMAIDERTLGTGAHGARARPFRPSAAGWAGRGVVWLAVAWLVLVFPLSRPATDLTQYTTAACYGIVALSLNVLLGYVGQISLGQQAFVGIGAFTSAYMVTEQGQSYWVAVLVAATIGGAQALVLGGVSLRVRGLYFALVTLSYGLVAEQNIFQIQELTGGGAGQPAPKPDWFDTEWRYYYLCLAFLAVVLYLDWMLMRSRAGRALLAVRENPRVASTFGIDVRMATLFAFVLSGIFAGLAGALIAHNDTFVSPDTWDFNLALVFVIMTVVGGLRSRTGLVIGGAFFALLPYLIEKIPGVDSFLAAIPAPSDLTPEIAPLVIGPLLLLLNLTVFPGGIGQQIRPVVRWLGGRRFDLHDRGLKEVQITDVRA